MNHWVRSKDICLAAMRNNAKEEMGMRALTSPEAGVAQGRQDLGLIICSGCEEMVDTIPTDGVKIIHGYCGKGECERNTAQNS
ncbi:hypothetical protein BBD41_20580 [Paenibacillus ihbetae]|uniref:GapA-binding peptide SR1P n=2 Tax=Paenibacillus ihbetae TaxID=1870820 RepID=A0A1B2E4C7_9BACL|nr:hypothetical protein BBD41_20580 [Paenibacillus ihbetae]